MNLNVCPVFSHGAQDVFHTGSFYPGEWDIYTMCSVGFSGSILNLFLLSLKQNIYHIDHIKM